MKTVIAYFFAGALLLNGCAAAPAAPAVITGAGNAAAVMGSIEPVLERLLTTPDEIAAQTMLNKYIAMHNLRWQMTQVDTAQGPVASALTISTQVGPPVVPSPPLPPSPPAVLSTRHSFFYHTR